MDPTLQLSSDSRSTAGVLLLTILFIEYGGWFVLRVVRGHVPMTDFQKSFARAGHAHAGVLVTLALVGLILVDAADVSGVAAFLARNGIWAAAVLMPAGDRKNPAGISTAAAQMPLRARNAATPLTSAASTRIRPTSARVTSTPACACPARAKLFWKSVIGTWPRTTRSTNQPPYSMNRIVSRSTPAVLRESDESCSVGSIVSSTFHNGISRDQPAPDTMECQGARSPGDAAQEPGTREGRAHAGTTAERHRGLAAGVPAPGPAHRLGPGADRAGRDRRLLVADPEPGLPGACHDGGGGAGRGGRAGPARPPALQPDRGGPRGLRRMGAARAGRREHPLPAAADRPVRPAPAPRAARAVPGAASIDPRRPARRLPAPAP